MDYFEFWIKDDDIFGAQVMGKVKIPAKKIIVGEVIIFLLLDPKSKNKNSGTDSIWKESNKLSGVERCKIHGC